MADNVAITAGSGTTVSTEEVTTLNGSAVSAQHLQRIANAVVTADGVAKDLLLGRQADANSLAVALSSEDVALLGATNETAPASDTASSGLNGRLQRIAQRITSLIALLPSALGQTTKTGSLAVTVASDDDLQGKLGSLTETAPASDTASSGLNGRLQRIAQRLTTIIAGIPLTAGEAHIGEVGGNLAIPVTAFTRPADTTAYAAGDVVSDSTSATTMQALANAARVSGGNGYITGIKIVTDKKSITPRLRIHFFNTNGATLAADNAAYKESYADDSKRVGWWDMPAMSTAQDTTNSDMSQSYDFNVRLPYTCAATSLYYVIQTLDAFTPASGENFRVTVFLDRN